MKTADIMNLCYRKGRTDSEPQFKPPQTSEADISSRWTYCHQCHFLWRVLDCLLRQTLSATLQLCCGESTSWVLIIVLFVVVFSLLNFVTRVFVFYGILSFCAKKFVIIELCQNKSRSKYDLPLFPPLCCSLPACPRPTMGHAWPDSQFVSDCRRILQMHCQLWSSDAFECSLAHCLLGASLSQRMVATWCLWRVKEPYKFLIWAENNQN